MEVPILTFSNYNKLPKIDEALKAIESFQATNDMMLFGDLFLKHHTHEAWGLCLIHRHFDLKPDEILLEQPSDNKTIIVSKATDVNQIVAPVTGSSYRFDDDNMSPFEFRYADTLQKTTQQEDFSSFQSDLKHKLAETGLLNVLGITQLTSTAVGIEATDYDNRENIVELIPPDTTVPTEDMVGTVWAFNRDGSNTLGWCVKIKMCITGHAQIKIHKK